MLIKLMLGVRKFQNEPFQQMQEIFAHLSEGQKPDILFITCADSRLLPNLLTQTKPGELFVIRNVGNIIPPSGVPSSEAAGIVYALNELESIKDIIICGHSHCGAMKGLLTPNLKDRLPEVSSWLEHAHSVLEQMNAPNTPKSKDFGQNVMQATKLNVLTQIEHLKSYPVVAQKMARGELNLHGWVYEFEKGEVLVYDPQEEEFIAFKDALAIAVSIRKDKLIEQVAMNYLETLSHPQTTQEYEHVIQLFSLLEKQTIQAIWPAIKTAATQTLWTELGGLFSDMDDVKFTRLLEQGCQLPLKNIRTFQKNIIESEGYHRYIGQIMRYSLFSPPSSYLTPILPPQETGTAYRPI